MHAERAGPPRTPKDVWRLTPPKPVRNDANMMLKNNPIFVALDTPSLDAATALAAHVAPFVGGLKLGLEFVSANGPEGVRTMVKSGLPVFLDVKLHDIPNTVAGGMEGLGPPRGPILHVPRAGRGAGMR